MNVLFKWKPKKNELLFPNSSLHFYFVLQYAGCSYYYKLTTNNKYKIPPLYLESHLV